MGPITATIDKGKVSVSAGGVDTEFDFDAVMTYVQEARHRQPTLTWTEALRDVSKKVAQECLSALRGKATLEDVAKVIYAGFCTLFNRFVDTVINAAYDLCEWGWNLVCRFFDWVVSFF